MWTYIGGVFVLISLLILPLVLAVSRRRRILKSIPGLEETFILGHTLHFMNKSPSVILETLNRGFRENGRVWKALLFHDTILLVSDPKIIEVSEKRFSDSVLSDIGLSEPKILVDIVIRKYSNGKFQWIRMKLIILSKCI